MSVNDAGMSVFEIRVNHQGYVHLLAGNDPDLCLTVFDPSESIKQHQELA